MTKTSSDSVMPVRANSLPPSPISGHGVAKNRVNGFKASEVVKKDEGRHFDPSKEPRLLHLI